MPDLANLSLTLTRFCNSLEPQLDLSTAPTADAAALSVSPVKTLVKDLESDNWEQNQIIVAPIQEEVNVDCSITVLNKTQVTRTKRGAGANGNGAKSLDDHVRVWIQSKMDFDASQNQSRCFLPFLENSKKLAECLICHHFINPKDGVSCSVRNCGGVYHLSCVEEKVNVLKSKKFKCPQHVCYLCKQRYLLWRCVRCEIASHDNCSPWKNDVVHLAEQPGRAVCWRHPIDWRLDKKHLAPASNIEEVFSRLPLPYADEEFKIETTWKNQMENKLEPVPYVHIRRNVYLVKKKRDDANSDVGCTNCSSSCGKNCVCRVQCISCSRDCRCSENCTNRPFRREKKIKLVKTELCGWGVVSAQPINKGDFIIEYIGEVIDDRQCEQRLWDMKYKGVQNFYMCEIQKDFTIDATFKGNLSRFLNHSCNPNCSLEKWQVEGETRVGVFAARSINVGEPLTYDYRFVQFGPEVKCHCGALNCQGFLGTKRKICKLKVSWGTKRKRTGNAGSADGTS